ncbi:DcrB-related protein (plasmid) [Polymorphobacter sp. PAMC 29334]|uniref:DcrB-related protein n=1 Tax=Polymorphobacter sp. PAMC 29334 TaxID=2862331 RepID=UPI001C78C31C|nr:DcrB-related protein [Polymorphobacter sp. PAMC 29334]
MIVHTAPPNAGQAVVPSVVIAREVRSSDEDFAEFCARQIAIFETTLPNYTLEGQQSGRIGDNAARRVDVRWNATMGAMRQQLSFIDPGDTTVISFTASAAADEFDEHQAVFDAQLTALANSSACLADTKTGIVNG